MNVTDLQVKAATDPEFRAALFADPRAALAAEGIQLPDDLTVRVVESTPQQVVLSIPAPVSEDVELGEDALAGASGGTTPAFPVALGLQWLGIAGGLGILGGAGYGAYDRWAK
ncbi:NHLP leader peptide family RiPP precursor [Nakamurella leprariae]|uniref:NHLP leader peptide family RiPP n=1 Tax=Nakamurella leprariae TaxID=2803911 RepID=A0A938YE19_9ACTN|nr:NHLP leader peptide family RiPP precursor [Nakamurella leprariae]MBM9466145.1 NHLP leader peptide family RiPP precursor [Nakamurella leprariae]